MKKGKRFFSIVMASLLIAFTVLGYLPESKVSAAAVPQVMFANPPITQYKAGDRVNFNIHAPNYGGRVQYRVVLWNDSKKTYYDLWNSSNGFPERYYTKWQPYGNNIFTLGWIIFEPGSYRITVYAKRAGIPNSKTAKKGYNCDSYMESMAFYVKGNESEIVSISPLDDVTVNVGETPRLPSYVKAATSDNLMKELKVTWPSVNTSTPGTVTVEGDVEGTTKKASIRVKVLGQTTINVDSVISTNNTVVNVNLKDYISYAPNTSVFTIKEFNSSANIPVYSANLSSDKKTITLSTAYMTSSKWYTLTVNNNAYNFVANQAANNGISLAAQNKQLALNESTYATVAKNPSDVSLSYTSSNPNVAYVDYSSGYITGKSSGIATITVKGTKYGYSNATTTFTVVVGNYNGVYAYAPNMEVNAGTNQYPVISKSHDDITIHFSSNKTAVATVDYYTGLIKGVTAGTATITMTISKYGYSSFTSTFTVTVKGQSVRITAYPNTLNEGPTSDGSFEDNIINVQLLEGVFNNWAYNGYYKDYVNIYNLPSGLDYTVEYVNQKLLRVRVTGKAYYHRNNDDANINIEINKALIYDGEYDLSSNNVYLNFSDYAAPAAPTNPRVDDVNDTFGWTFVSGYDKVSDYEYSINNGANYATCTANPQPVGDKDLAIGEVSVRVRAALGNAAGVPLLSDKKFTKKPISTKPVLKALRIKFTDAEEVTTISPNAGVYMLPDILLGRQVASLSINVTDDNIDKNYVKIIDENANKEWATLDYTAKDTWTLTSMPKFDKVGECSLYAIFKDLSGNSVVASISGNVIDPVPTISVIEDLKIIKILMEDFRMPDVIKAKMTDGSLKDVPVLWEEELNTYRIGEFIAYGKVKGYDKPVKMILTVIGPSIVSIDNIEKEVFVGEKYELPKMIPAKMNNGKIWDVAVVWNPTSLPTDVAGKFEATGTVLMNKGEVKLYLTVKDKQ